LLMAYSLLEGNYLKNKKVIVPAISWITTLSPFLQFGFEVFLCDSNAKNLGINTIDLEQLFIKENPSLLIVVHVLAHLNDMDEIYRLCKKYNVLLIEDACEALGTSNTVNKRAGNLSLAGSFSFYYGHHISTIEGGAVTTNDTKLYNLMLSIRSHGWSRDVDGFYKEQWKNEFDIDQVREFYTFYFPGFNLRSTDLNAFLGLSQLDRIEEIVSVRQNNYNLYNKYLEGKYWKQESQFNELSSFAYGTLVENREEVFNHLKNNNIEVRPLICGSMGKQPFWIKKFGYMPLKVADIVHDYGLYFPNHLYIDEEKIKYITDKFKEVAIPKFI
jgi:CDP-6-deoxy-D-xylo-4-hexulose-3-dehydrase